MSEPITLYATKGKKTTVVYGAAQVATLVESGDWMYRETEQSETAVSSETPAKATAVRPKAKGSK
jgi:hypothetical protein